MPWIEVDETTLFYREAGKGRLAVFIHGFPLDNTLWIDQIEGLRHVRRCVAVDLRGHGRSAPLQQPVLTMEAMAADVAALIGALGEDDADVVGLSMGGYVALALVSDHPERVRTLTLMDTRATADSAAARSGRDAMIARLLASGRSVIADEMIEALLGSDPSSRAVARLRAMVEGTRYETFTAVLHGMKRRLDRTALLGSIEVPSLVIGGDQDTLIPVDEAHALAAAIPGARTTIVRGAGHLPPIEQPDQVNGALIEHFEGRKVVWWRRS
jgi:pimeloyl-ACP methyl ester carboxylesterase